MSDRVKGLDRALEVSFPFVQLAKCCKHLADGLFGKKGEAGRKLLYSMAECRNAEVLKEIKAGARKDKGTRSLLEKIERSTKDDIWCDMEFTKGPRLGEYSQNTAESFNAAIRGARALGPARMFVDIRRLTGRWANAHLRNIEKLRKAEGELSLFVPLARDELLRSQRKAKTYTVTLGTTRADVQTDTGENFVVGWELDNNQKPTGPLTCSCRAPQLDLRVCSHCCAALLEVNLRPQDFMPHFWRSEAAARIHSLLPQPEDALADLPHDGTRPPRGHAAAGLTAVAVPTAAAVPTAVARLPAASRA
eukprot:TRINITY_DN4304_c0_g1_i1.p2 TRINITY_DN4304_c0_g1~~TRINITY_DN4304_c0_g1_i1.p2  ORF type:complete len:306 (-),score=62.09 TRINITY_DN4304_c0_g1_i1:298-1215(-)